MVRWHTPAADVLDSLDCLVQGSVSSNLVASSVPVAASHDGSAARMLSACSLHGPMVSGPWVQEQLRAYLPWPCLVEMRPDAREWRQKCFQGSGKALGADVVAGNAGSGPCLREPTTVALLNAIGKVSPLLGGLGSQQPTTVDADEVAPAKENKLECLGSSSRLPS